MDIGTIRTATNVEPTTIAETDHRSAVTCADEFLSTMRAVERVLLHGNTRSAVAKVTRLSEIGMQRDVALNREPWRELTILERVHSSKPASPFEHSGELVSYILEVLKPLFQIFGQLHNHDSYTKGFGARRSMRVSEIAQRLGFIETARSFWTRLQVEEKVQVKCPSVRAVDDRSNFAPAREPLTAVRAIKGVAVQSNLPVRRAWGKRR